MKRQLRLIGILLHKDFRLFWPFAMLIAVLIALWQFPPVVAQLGPLGFLLQTAIRASSTIPTPSMSVATIAPTSPLGTALTNVSGKFWPARSWTSRYPHCYVGYLRFGLTCRWNQSSCAAAPECSA